MRLDKITPWGHLIPHQHAKDPVGFGRTFDRYLLQGPRIRIHRGIPKLITVHFTKTFVTLHRDTVFLTAAQTLNQRLPLVLIPGIRLFLALLYMVTRRL